jgi:hypothetical protein
MNHGVAVGAKGYKVPSGIHNGVWRDDRDRFDVMHLYKSGASGPVTLAEVETTGSAHGTVNLDTRRPIQGAPLVSIALKTHDAAFCIANALVLDWE